MQLEYRSHSNAQPRMLPTDVAAPIPMYILMKRLADGSAPQRFQHLPAPDLTLAHSQFGVWGKEQTPFALGSLLKPLLRQFFARLERLNVFHSYTLYGYARKISMLLF